MLVMLDDYVQHAEVATKLVNTAPLVWSTGVDHLGDVPALREFLSVHGLVTARPAAGDLAAVHHLRDRLRPVVEHADLAGASALTGGASAVTIVPDRGWAVDVPDDAAAGRLLAVVAGLGVLGARLRLGPDRFRTCAAGCLGLFIDTSRAGRRRFCMPELCGNRINTARHRARRRSFPDDSREPH